jgi:hypothetical protein
MLSLPVRHPSAAKPAMPRRAAKKLNCRFRQYRKPAALIESGHGQEATRLMGGALPKTRVMDRYRSKAGGMKSLTDFQILPQPNETTCGPTCLHAVFRFFDDEMPLEKVIAESPELEDGGGTLGVLLGQQALGRGYHARIYTYNLRVFDPSWFEPVVNGNRGSHPVFSGPADRVPCVDLIDKLEQQIRSKDGVKLQLACHAYIRFLKQGGEICMHDLSKPLIRHFLESSIPILTGLSSTYLYMSPRERQRDMKADDIRGTPTGHFVVLCGETRHQKMVRIADPYVPNPVAKDRYYEVSFDRLICSILLGVLTYDANLLLLKPHGKH